MSVWGNHRGPAGGAGEATGSQPIIFGGLGRLPDGWPRMNGRDVQYLFRAMRPDMADLFPFDHAHLDTLDPRSKAYVQTYSMGGNWGG